MGMNKHHVWKMAQNMGRGAISVVRRRNSGSYSLENRKILFMSSNEADRGGGGANLGYEATRFRKLTLSNQRYPAQL